MIPQGTGFNFWYLVFDDARVNLDRAPYYVQVLRATEQDFAQRVSEGKLDFAPLEELLKGQERKKSLLTILIGFRVPLL